MRFSLAGENLTLCALSEGAIRVRSTLNSEFSGQFWALLDAKPVAAEIRIEEEWASISTGRLEARVSPSGHIEFRDPTEGRLLLEEVRPCRPWSRSGRSFEPLGGGTYAARAWFEAAEDESFYGLGQHHNGTLDQKGCVIDLEQKNTEVTIPFFVSSRGYGFLWNCPSIGRVELAKNGTRWFAEQAREIDYVVMAGPSCAEVLSAYFRVSGEPPPAPDWATGFWQSKLRYRSQDELLAVAREYRRRGLPLSVIVADYFHWTAMGDWRFDPADWPDPAAMIEELRSMDVVLAVSVWPSVNPDSENYEEMHRGGLLLESVTGIPFFYLFEDTGSRKKVPMAYYDPSRPEARRYVWDKIRRNYHELGAASYWLDACEPELQPYAPRNLRMAAGTGAEVANLYPFFHEQAFYEGMREAGETKILNLCRSAWAGSQRFGALVWSGDVDSDFPSLARQIRAGLNMAMSGIPWWTTDIGGFFGGDIEDENFRELLVRWFQFGVFCPVTRLHGFRNSWDAKAGADNELWSFGEEAYAILTRLLALRESLRPHIAAFAERELPRGRPFMRPLFFDFPGEPDLRGMEDEYLFLDDLLVAPVAEAGSRSRPVVLPAGKTWIDPYTGRACAGGGLVEAEAPIDRIPVFVVRGSPLLSSVDWKGRRGTARGPAAAT
ncbi:MAG: TIM-barrel domain-containing protein [Rectinemataceae bacterium]